MKIFQTIMDINYETNSSFLIFSPVEHPKILRAFLDASPTLNKGERGILTSKMLGFCFVSNYFVHDCRQLCGGSKLSQHDLRLNKNCRRQLGTNREPWKNYLIVPTDHFAFEYKDSVPGGGGGGVCRPVLRKGT